MSSKPYRQIPIRENLEPLLPIPLEAFGFYAPHPYVAAEAPYGGISPWQLRKGVLEALFRAQTQLSALKPGWKIKLFDAYRPNAVQAYMVEREVGLCAKEAGLNPALLSPEERAVLMPKVFRLWSIPSEDPATPPLHSTGGALDCTLQDETGAEIDMGSPIDENSDRSNPDYFKTSPVHANRVFLNELLTAEGFVRHLAEWWHFSLGDQYWAWRQREEKGTDTVAVYGRADRV